MKNKVLLLGLTTLVSITMTVPTFAAWHQDTNKKRWINDDGSLAANGWKWIDDNGDGIKECFYFDANGYVLTDTRTPDGYMVNSKGEWVVDGEIQRAYPEVEESKPKKKEVTVDSLITDNKEFFDRLLDAASTGNNDAMFAEMGYMSNLTNVFNQFPNKITEICYPSNNGTGIKINKKNGYVYYGPLVDGKAEGQGKGYYKQNPVTSQSSGNFYFDGTWSNDAPNGFGIETRTTVDKTANHYPMTLIISGNYTNWYENGNMTRIYTSGKTGESRTFRYEAYNGLGIAIGRNWFAQSEHDVIANSEELGSQCQLTFYETEQSALTRGAQSHLDSHNRGFAHNSWYFDPRWNY